MKEFRNTLESLLPNADYQERWLGYTCFNLSFISKVLAKMKDQDMDITEDDLDTYARMPIDVMIEKRPELLRKVLTAIVQVNKKAMENSWFFIDDGFRADNLGIISNQPSP